MVEKGKRWRVSPPGGSTQQVVLKMKANQIGSYRDFRAMTSTQRCQRLGPTQATMPCIAIEGMYSQACRWKTLVLWGRKVVRLGLCGRLKMQRAPVITETRVDYCTY